MSGVKRYKRCFVVAIALGVLLAGCIGGIGCFLGRLLTSLLEGRPASTPEILWLTGLTALGVVLLFLIPKTFLHMGEKAAQDLLQSCQGQETTEEKRAFALRLRKRVYILSGQRSERVLLIVAVVGVLLTVGLTSLWMSLILLAAAILCTGLILWNSRVQKPLCQNQEEHLLALREYAKEALEGRLIIEAFNLESKWISGCREKSQALYEAERKRKGRPSKISGLIWLITWSAYIAAALVGAGLAKQGMLPWGSFFINLVFMLLLYYLLNKLYLAWQNAIGNLAEKQKNRSSAG